MLPRKNYDLFDEIFNDTFFKNESKTMKTDIRENENNYIIDIDLPGYDKENIKIMLEEGYLTVTAETKETNDQTGKYVKKERYYGTSKRSFYIGENIEVEEIKANFKNGILSLQIPKKEPEEELPNKKYIEIED